MKLHLGVGSFYVILSIFLATSAVYLMSHIVPIISDLEDVVNGVEESELILTKKDNSKNLLRKTKFVVSAVTITSLILALLVLIRYTLNYYC